MFATGSVIGRPRMLRVDVGVERRRDRLHQPARGRAAQGVAVPGVDRVRVAARLRQDDLLDARGVLLRQAHHLQGLGDPAVQPARPDQRLGTGLLGVHRGELLREPARLLHRRHPLVDGLVVDGVRDGQHRRRGRQRPEPLRGLQHTGARREDRTRALVHVRDGGHRVRGGRGAGRERGDRAGGDGTERGGRRDDLDAPVTVRRGAMRGAVPDRARGTGAARRGAVTSHGPAFQRGGATRSRAHRVGEARGAGGESGSRCTRDEVVTLGA